MKIDEHSLVRELPKFLRWNSGDEVVMDACLVHVAWAFQQLRRWSDHHSSTAFERVRVLPQKHQQRLLLAPRTVHLLEATNAPDIEQMHRLEGLIAMEECLVAPGRTRFGTSWTALGDYCAPINACDCPEVGKDSPIYSEVAQGGYTAPRLRHIIIDAYSPHARTFYPPSLGALVEHSREEVRKITRRVGESIEHIRAVSSTAFSMVDASVQVIAVAKSVAQPDCTSSVSHRSLIGRVGLINTESERWPLAKISNALVHEAIHSLIYKIEMKEPLYVDQEAAWQLTTVSPWSGRTLLLHSFVHACFVWYGLLSFWRMDPNETQESRKHYETALGGFRKGRPLSFLSPEAYACIQPNAIHAIEELTDRVLSASNN